MLAALALVPMPVAADQTVRFDDDTESIFIEGLSSDALARALLSQEGVRLRV